MLIKKFVGRDIEVIEHEINDELGPDAIILMTRRIEEGFLASLIGGGDIEVTAGVEAADLKKWNPTYEGMEEFEAITLTPFHSSPHINCSGPIAPDADGSVTIIPVVGLNEKAVSDTCIKLAQHLHRETPYRAALLSIKQIYDAIPKQFYEMAEKHELAYDVILDRYSLMEAINKYKDYDFILIRFPETMHASSIKIFLNGAQPLWIQLVLSNGEDLSAYKKLYPQGLIVNNPDAELEFHKLPEIHSKIGIPLSYVSHEGKLIVAKPDHLEMMIINSRLKS